MSTADATRGFGSLYVEEGRASGERRELDSTRQRASAIQIDADWNGGVE